jgi:hypothetical protein
MKLLEILAAFHNWLSDKDFIWWPFSFLRPEPHVPMTLNLTLQMTGCFGGLTFVFLTVFSIANNAFSLESSLFTLLGCIIGFFLWFNLITKPLWNIRARKLKK